MFNVPQFQSQMRFPTAQPQPQFSANRPMMPMNPNQGNGTTSTTQQPTNPLAQAVNNTQSATSLYNMGSNMGTGAAKLANLYGHYFTPTGVPTAADGTASVMANPLNSEAGAAAANNASFMAGNGATQGSEMLGAPQVGGWVAGATDTADGAATGASVMGGADAAGAGAATMGADAAGAAGADAAGAAAGASMLGPVGLGAAGLYGAGKMFNWW